MTIVIGYLPTPEGEAALEAAIVEARRLAAGLVVVSGVDAVSDSDFDISPEQHADALSDKLDRLDLQNVVVPHDPTADPATEILTQARSRDASMIVIGLRRRTPVGKLILGSTAQRILLEADCPVLAVKRAGVG
ncbi:universal stress protein [Angustibacter luteus]|uniref:Universal stress protein n=1 Tax=Angustibacter luteus TaxID=658456 RepID=A0ABW1JGW5_9ACTN